PQARFQDTYQITWAVSATPMGAMKYSLSSFTGDLTTFREGEGASGTYTLTATGTAVNSGHTGTASQNITTATCTSPTPTFTNEASDPAIGFTVTPASADGFYSANPQSVFTGDTVNLSSPTTFACYTNQAEAAAQYTWGLKEDVGATRKLTGGIHSTTPTVAQVNGAAFGSTIFVGDAVKVATSATSACFASPTFTYAYTLKQGAVTASETFSPSPTVAQPTFVPQVFGASYEVSVTIGDGSGQTSSPTTSLAIAVSSCGVTSPTVSFTATQHLESVQQKVGTDTPTTALDLTQKSGATTTTITIDVGGTSQAIEVPFYLATPVDVALKAAAPSCSSVTFNSAQLFDPDGHEVPTTDWTQPSPQSVSA